MGARAGAFAAFNMGFAEGSQAAAGGPHWQGPGDPHGQGTALGPQAGHLFPAFCGFAIEDYMSVAILDGGASLSAGGFKVLQSIVDKMDSMGTKVDLMPATANFTFAGGAGTAAKTKLALPLESMGGAALEVHCLPTEQTHLLIGVDMLDKWGLVLDYYNSAVYSHVLGRFLDCLRTVGGHLALRCDPAGE